MKFCTNCIMPDTKPDLSFDENGVCNACNNYNNRTEVDWDSRKEELKTILAKYKNKSGSNWDCIVPVSGGKDSTYQVIKILQMGLNPLCVTATTCDLAEIGRKNIEHLKELGVDYMEITANPIVRKKLNRLGLLDVGDVSWPEHVQIFTTPVRMAVQLKIPLIIWGENPQNEYGGPAASTKDNTLTRRWLEEFGGLLGLRVSDMIGQDGIEKRDMIPYTYPSDEELQEVGVTGLFLGYYIPWDGYANTLLAQAHGFESYHKTIEGSCVNYENLDNYQTGIHDYFKYLKFGFGRASDLASMHVRRGRMTREDAVDVIGMHDGKFPWEYIGQSIEETLSKIDVTLEEYIKICDRFTNKKLFKTDSKGNLVKDKKGNLSLIYNAGKPADLAGNSDKVAS